MKDQRGLYYYPFPQNKRVRMYVKLLNDEVAFRLWNQDDPEMWDNHGWVPNSAIEQAKRMYQGGKFDPSRAYDLALAEAVIREASALG